MDDTADTKNKQNTLTQFKSTNMRNTDNESGGNPTSIPRLSSQISLEYCDI